MPHNYCPLAAPNRAIKPMPGPDMEPHIAVARLRTRPERHGAPAGYSQPLPAGAESVGDTRPAMLHYTRRLSGSNAQTNTHDLQRIRMPVHNARYSA